MANQVEICNIALSRAAVSSSIQSFAENSREAQACRKHYTICRDSVLEDYDWPFARRQGALAALTITQEGWGFVYALPSNCIAARRIFNPLDPKGVDPAKRIEWERMMHPTEETGILCCDVEGPTLIYTTQVTVAGAFSALFADMFGYRLAAELAHTLRGDQKLMAGLFKIYSNAISNASGRNVNQGFLAPAGDGSIVASRQ